MFLLDETDPVECLMKLLFDGKHSIALERSLLDQRTELLEQNMVDLRRQMSATS